MPAEALQKIRQKYPQYADIPDQELARRILAKYPQYQDLLGDVAAGPATSRQPVLPTTFRGQVARTIFGPQGFMGPTLEEQRRRQAGGLPPRAPGGLLPLLGEGFFAGGVTAPAVIGRAATAALPKILRVPAQAAGRFAQRAGERLVETARGVSPEAQVVIQRVTQAIRAAKPVRAEQEALSSAERSRRLGKILAAGERDPTIAGTKRMLAAARGELPKAQFVPLEVSRADQDTLVKLITQNPRIQKYEQLRARAALLDLFNKEGGRVPTEGDLELLQRAFGTDLVRELVKKRPIIQRSKPELVAGMMRALLATFDLSGFRQLAFAIPRFPRLVARNVAPMLRAAATEQGYGAVAQEIGERASLPLMRRGGVALSAVDDVIGLTKEEGYAVANLALKIPGVGRVVRGSERAFNAILTKTRADIFDYMTHQAQRTFGDLADNQLVAIGNFVNTATGRGQIPKALGLSAAGKALPTVLWAPRLLFSRLTIVNPWYYIKADPVVRKELWRTAAAFYGTMGAAMGIATVMSGARTEWDPRSADFGKFIIPHKPGPGPATIRALPPIFGGSVMTYASESRYEISGGILPYIRFAAQLARGMQISTITGEPITDRGRPLTRWKILGRIITSKSSPALSLMRAAFGEEQFGQPFSPMAVIRQFIPMVIQDWDELRREEGDEDLFGLDPWRVWSRVDR